uniref:p53 DNA-binding domain-containing protein n=1 Tax=Stomoxys calcitrans TaxID=35570 RepID=A0A1I8QBH4_STOCA
MMLQTGCNDAELNDACSTPNYLCHRNTPNDEEAGIGNLANLCSISFEDLLSHQCQGESTLPPVETVLPRYEYINATTTSITPPPSIPSPSIFAPNTFDLVTTNTTQPHTQHNHINIKPMTNPNMLYQISANANPNMIQPQQFNHMRSTNNISSTGVQLLNVVDRNFSNNSEPNSNTLEALHNISQMSPDNATVYVSDASTVDASENDLLTDEPFTYLQNLNSDNLMKFSQQSEIMHLMDQMVEPKMTNNCIPLAEEHDQAGYDFRIQFNCGNTSSRAVLYSKDTKRLYVRPHENVTFDCTFKVKMPIQPLNVRILPIYTKDTSEPVLRCANHISKDTEPDEIIRSSLLRCENLGAIYHGSDTGKSIKERYSVVVPLNAAVKVNDGSNYLKQQVIISFTCNNSCNGRKEIAALFLLETMNGDILAQRELSVKISTCPKRDRKLYEKTETVRKRPPNEPEFIHEPKMPKFDESYIKDEFSRSSYGEPSDDETSGPANGDCSRDDIDVSLDPENGGYVLKLRYRTRQQMLDVLRVLYSNAVSNEVFYKSTVRGKRTRDSEQFRRCYEKSLRLSQHPDHQQP